MVAVCIESGVGAQVDNATLAWVYESPLWGLCGQGADAGSALADLSGRAIRDYAVFLARHGETAPLLDAAAVVEHIEGDEQCFGRDLEPATDEELDGTVAVLRWARADLRELVATSSDAELDWDDPERVLPAWARWRTLRQMAWHIADTESRYYLAGLGVVPPERSPDLGAELARSHRHVLDALPRLERDRARTADGGVWTTRKVLRRLAWHERSELDAMCLLRDRARRALADRPKAAGHG